MSEMNNIIRRIRNADADAFQELFDLYQEDVFRFLQFKLGDTQAAEDILQDVFIKVWENRRTLKENASLKSFLFTIANRAALNHIRHNKIVLKFQLEHQHANETNETPYVEYEHKEIQKLLVHAIAALPEKPRTAFLMSRFQDLTYREVAERLDVSVKTVECHIGKALRLLRESLHVAA